MNGRYIRGKENTTMEAIKIVNSLIKERKKIKILDLGCGEGSFLKILKASLPKKILDKINYYAMDMAEEYKEKIFTLGVKEFILGDATQLHKYFPKNNFDFIIASEILEHVENTDGLMKSIYFGLKNSGFAYITTPNLASYHGRIELLFGSQPFVYEVSNERADLGKGWIYHKFYGGEISIHHIRCFTRKALLEFAKHHQFKIIKNTGSSLGHLAPIWKYIPSLAPIEVLVLKKITRD
jgi:ubiquinone/menaquinone biosynthesis C-methylase UbiE